MFVRLMCQVKHATAVAAHIGTWLRDEEAACIAKSGCRRLSSDGDLVTIVSTGYRIAHRAPCGSRSLRRLGAGNGRSCRKKKNIFLVWLVWPLITLGIYFFVWYYKVNREARDFDPEIDVAPAVSLLAVLIGWIIIIPPFVSIYRTGERIAKMQSAAGLQPTSSAIIGLLLTFAFHLETLYYQNELNRIWDHYKDLPEGTPVQLAIPAA